MRISRVSYQTNPYFNGEHSKKNRLRNAAGAAAIAIATAAPLSDAKGQVNYYDPFMMPPPISNIDFSSYEYDTDVLTVPNCLVIGDQKKNDADEKTISTIFNEIDQNKDGELSLDEVIKVERRNWGLVNVYPYTQKEYDRTTREFKTLAKLYNEENSKTINKDEYKSIIYDCEGLDLKKKTKINKNKDKEIIPMYVPIPIFTPYTIPSYDYRPYRHYDYQYRPHRHRNDPPPYHYHW